MNLLKYILFSSLEYFSVFIFILVQFRFSLRENLSPMLLISLLLSFVSYTFASSDLEGFFPLIQFIFVLFYIKFVLKVSIINATIMFFTGYMVFGLLQTCVMTVAMYLKIIEGKLIPGTDVAFSVQLSTTILILLYSGLIYYLKGGFSFIESRSRFSSKTFKGINRKSIVFIFISFFVTIIANIVIVELSNPPYLPVAFVLLVFLLILFYFSLRRDEVVD